MLFVTYSVTMGGRSINYRSYRASNDNGKVKDDSKNIVLVNKVYFTALY
jgi:hypothetical protein